ncbi:hypothetical protein BHE74_00008856 [Ensete ventricosum]|nr:hypothetical protein BHE74_00008856 [Ensete ventricosum]
MDRDKKAGRRRRRTRREQARRGEAKPAPPASAVRRGRPLEEEESPRGEHGRVLVGRPSETGTSPLP